MLAFDQPLRGTGKQAVFAAEVIAQKSRVHTRPLCHCSQRKRLGRGVAQLFNGCIKQGFGTNAVNGIGPAFCA